MELYILANLKVLISNTIIVFSNSGLEVPKSDIFGPKFKVFFVLDETLQFHKFQGVDFKYGSRFLKLQPKNTQIK